jgi:hypothetical protein
MRAARPWGVFLMAIFFAVATCIAVSVGVALLFQASAMKAVWKAYPAPRALSIAGRPCLVVRGLWGGP